MNTENSPLNKALGYGVRASLFAATPAYLLMKGPSLSNRGVQAIAVIYGPPLVILGAGVAEATIRTVAHLFMAYVATQQQKQRHLNSASAEMKTAHKLVRGAVMPIDGYAVLAVEIYTFIHYTPNGRRSLINDYYVYHTPFIVAKHSYTYVAKPVSKTTWKVIVFVSDNSYRFVIGPVFRATWRVTKATCIFGYDVLDAVGFWTGLTTVASYSALVIQAGVGVAMKMLGR